ncbi:MAG: hypothetical protein U1D30_02570 [Planctomycetota bacterium]
MVKEMGAASAERFVTHTQAATNANRRIEKRRLGTFHLLVLSGKPKPGSRGPRNSRRTVTCRVA